MVFFVFVVVQMVTFYSTGYCESSEWIARFNPDNSPGAAKLTLPRYQFKSRNVQLDLNLHAYRRTARREDKHPASPCVAAVARIVVFCAVGPSEEDRQD